MPAPSADLATWLKVRDAYVNREGSCAELAVKFGLNPEAVSTRCRREGWRNYMRSCEERLTEKLSEKVEIALTKRAERMAERAVGFVNRTLDESEDWLDRVQTAKKLCAEGDIDALKKLVSTWEVPVRVGRQALGLDRKADTNVIVNNAQPDYATLTRWLDEDLERRRTGKPLPPGTIVIDAETGERVEEES